MTTGIHGSCDDTRQCIIQATLQKTSTFYSNRLQNSTPVAITAKYHVQKALSNKSASTSEAKAVSGIPPRLIQARLQLLCLMLKYFKLDDVDNDGGNVEDRRKADENSEEPTGLTIASARHTTLTEQTGDGRQNRIDIGSLFVKYGFSGESKPRHVTYHSEPQLHQLYKLEVRNIGEVERLLSDTLRNLYHINLLTDPKQRKVILCENVLLPMMVKGAIARVLFNVLQVPSIIFLPSHVLALLTVGKTTGLAVDVGYNETILLPIYDGRPLLPNNRPVSLRSWLGCLALTCSSTSQTCSAVNRQILKIRAPLQLLFLMTTSSTMSILLPAQHTSGEAGEQQPMGKEDGNRGPGFFFLA
ncbi:hypothetical protein BJ742DRAFT_743390 [Cladochytrium replicatum]|nr:hypothetical protein BJ742DRAFT_743390 [Cladochytrium replicatum]